MKLASALRSIAVGSALAVAGVGAQASVMLGSSDCDGVIGIADVCYVSSYSTYTLDILYTDVADTSGGDVGLSAFSLVADDPLEITSLSFSFSAVASASITSSLILSYVVPSTGDAALGIGYILGTALSDGDVIGTLTYTTGLVGHTPDDDQNDILLAGSRVLGTTVFDPYFSAAKSTKRAGLDVQSIPVPMPAVLLLGGIGALAGLRRRAA